VRSAFHFEDRGTAIDLAATLNLTADGSPHRLITKGRNYRLFASDAEVTTIGGSAHVRDIKQERDVTLGGRPFFPIDNYAPIGVQEELIRYWNARGRPAEIQSAPAGPIRITSRAVIVAASQTSGSPPPNPIERLRSTASSGARRWPSSIEGTKICWR
jgi:hypothetical protein